MLCGLSNYSTPSLASPASRSPRARLGQHEHWSTPSNLEGSMHKQSAGVQLHLCLLAPQAPPAPCHCSLTPGTCPHALHQNPRRLPAAPVGNSSGRLADNMRMVALPRAPEMLPQHHFLDNTPCKWARNTRKPLPAACRIHKTTQHAALT